MPFNVQKSLGFRLACLFFIICQVFNEQVYGHVAFKDGSSGTLETRSRIELYVVSGEQLELYTCAFDTVGPNPTNCLSTPKVSVSFSGLFSRIQERVSQPAADIEVRITNLSHEISVVDLKIDELLNHNPDVPESVTQALDQWQKELIKREEFVAKILTDLDVKAKEILRLKQLFAESRDPKLLKDISILEEEAANLNRSKDTKQAKIMSIKTKIIELRAAANPTTKLTLLRQHRDSLAADYTLLTEKSKDIWERVSQVLYFKNTIIGDPSFTYVIPKEKLGTTEYPFIELKNLFFDYRDYFKSIDPMKPFPVPPLVVVTSPPSVDPVAGKNPLCKGYYLARVPEDFDTVQQGIDALLKTGGVVCVGKGVFKMPTPLFVDLPEGSRTNIKIVGISRSETIFTDSEEKGALDVSIRYSSEYQSLEFADLTIHGTVNLIHGGAQNDFKMVRTFCKALLASDAESRVPSNISITESMLRLVSIKGTVNQSDYGNDIGFYNSVIYGEGLKIRGSVDLGMPTRVRLLYNTIYGVATSSGAIDIENLFAASVFHNVFFNNTIGLNGQKIEQVTIYGNSFVGNRQNFTPDLGTFAFNNFTDNVKFQIRDSVPVPETGSVVCKSGFPYIGIEPIDFFLQKRDKVNSSIGAVQCD